MVWGLWQGWAGGLRGGCGFTGLWAYPEDKVGLSNHTAQRAWVRTKRIKREMDAPQLQAQGEYSYSAPAEQDLGLFFLPDHLQKQFGGFVDDRGLRIGAAHNEGAGALEHISADLSLQRRPLAVV